MGKKIMQKIVNEMWLQYNEVTNYRSNESSVRINGKEICCFYREWRELPDHDIDEIWISDISGTTTACVESFEQAISFMKISTDGLVIPS